jgi:hypothetical protein
MIILHRRRLGGKSRIECLLWWIGPGDIFGWILLWTFACLLSFAIFGIKVRSAEFVPCKLLLGLGGFLRIFMAWVVKPSIGYG